MQVVSYNEFDPLKPPFALGLKLRDQTCKFREFDYLELTSFQPEIKLWRAYFTNPQSFSIEQSESEKSRGRRY